MARRALFLASTLGSAALHPATARAQLPEGPEADGTGLAQCPLPPKLQGDDRGLATQLHENADDARKHGDLESAATLYGDLYRLHPGVRETLDYATTLTKLGRHCEALELFRRLDGCERYLEDEGVAELRAARALAEQGVGHVIVSCGDERLQAEIDQRILSPTELDALLPLDPGQHEVIFSGRDAKRQVRDFRIAAGERVTITCELPTPPMPCLSPIFCEEGECCDWEPCPEPLVRLGPEIAPAIAANPDREAAYGGGRVALVLGIHLAERADLRLGAGVSLLANDNRLLVAVGGSPRLRFGVNDWFGLGLGIEAGYLHATSQPATTGFAPTAGVFVMPQISPFDYQSGRLGIGLRIGTMLTQQAASADDRFSLSYVIAGIDLRYLFVVAETDEPVLTARPTGPGLAW